MVCCIFNECRNMSLWDLLAWRCPKVTGALLGSVLLLISFFWYMEYTMVTFVCRALQLLLAAGGVLGVAKMGQLTADDIEGAVDRFVNAAGSRAVGAAKSAYGVAAWRNPRVSGVVLLVTSVAGFIGNNISDSAFFALAVLMAFTLPAVYEKKKDVIDAWVEKGLGLADKYVGQLNTRLSDMNKKSK